MSIFFISSVISALLVASFSASAQKRYDLPVSAIDQTLCDMEASYNSGKTAYNDAIYDSLLRLRQNHTGKPTTLFSVKNCPVPYNINRFRQAHAFFMGSLKKANSIDEMKTFLATLGVCGETKSILQPKVDGIAVELGYKKGVLTSAITRGNGKYGRNIFDLVTNIPSIPSCLFDSDNALSSKNVTLHGELFVMRDRKATDKIVADKERHWLAGFISKKYPDPAYFRHIGFFPWQWVDSANKTFWQDIQCFSSWGFSEVEALSHQVTTMDEIISWYNKYNTLGEDAPMLMDGIVVKRNQKEEGSLTESRPCPGQSIAWKFPPGYAAVQVQDIHWQKGKKGRNTAVLIFNPVSIQGISVSRVSAGGMKNMKKTGIKKGDIISIALKGHSIPVLDGVLVRP